MVEFLVEVSNGIHRFSTEGKIISFFSLGCWTDFISFHFSEIVVLGRSGFMQGYPLPSPPLLGLRTCLPLVDGHEGLSALWDCRCSRTIAVKALGLHSQQSSFFASGNKDFLFYYSLSYPLKIN